MTLPDCNVTVACRSRSRSRSPGHQAARTTTTHILRQETTSAKRSFRPQVKDWVMVRRGSRRWSDAVPALVTKIREAADALPTVDLVIPNLLSLRFGFGCAKPFFEMLDVDLKELRAYTGCEQSKLKEQLLKAIRLDCRTRCASQSGTLIITAKRLGTLPLSAPLPLPPQEQDVVARATHEDAGWDFLRHFDPTDFAEEFTSELASLAAADYDSRDGHGTQPMQETQPQEKQEAVFLCEEDPATPCRRQVVRQVTPPDPPAPSDSLKKRSPVAEELPPKARSRPRDASWLLEFTCAVSRAFRRAKESELTQQELGALMAEASGVNRSNQELQEGLKALDSQNKVFLSGDLVFMI